jgi:hypothetical protein
MQINEQANVGPHKFTYSIAHYVWFSCSFPVSTDEHGYSWCIASNARKVIGDEGSLPPTRLPNGCVRFCLEYRLNLPCTHHVVTKFSFLGVSLYHTYISIYYLNVFCKPFNIIIIIIMYLLSLLLSFIDIII